MPKLKLGLCVLLAAVLLGQLPATAKVLTDKEAADFVAAANVLKNQVPEGAIVIFDTPAPAGLWHQPFSGEERNLGQKPVIMEPRKISHHPRKIGPKKPVFLLILGAECASTSLCDEPGGSWYRHIDGWEVKKRFDHFTLYKPTEGQRGREGAEAALRAVADAFGPGYNAADIYGVANLMKVRGASDEARAYLAEAYAELDSKQAEAYRKFAHNKHLDPFE